MIVFADTFVHVHMISSAKILFKNTTNWIFLIYQLRQTEAGSWSAHRTSVLDLTDALLAEGEQIPAAGYKIFGKIETRRVDELLSSYLWPRFPSWQSGK